LLPIFFEKNLALIKEFSLNDFPFSFGLLSFRLFSRKYGDAIEAFFDPLLFFLVWLE